MKKVFILTICLFVITILQAQDYKKKDIKKIHKFLLTLQKAAITQDTVVLKKLIYPIKSEDGIDYRKKLIDYILENDERDAGDLSYSHRAFKQITDSLYTKFKPIPFKIYAKLARDKEFYVLQDVPRERIPIFDYKHAHIILLYSKGKYKLMFWE